MLTASSNARSVSLKFGVMLTNYDTLPSLIAQTQLAEKLGFESVLFPDHYVWGGGGRVASTMQLTSEKPFTFNTHEILALIPYLAAKTTTIKLGTGVLVAPFRPPAMVAKMISTIDLLAKGRLIFGVGVGWNKADFGFAPNEWVEPKERVEKTEEAVQLMVKLWTEDVVNFKGKYYATENAVLEPKPFQKPHPELWVGVHGKKALMIAAKYAKAWCSGPNLNSADKYREDVGLIKKSLKKIGRNEDFTYAAMASFIPDGGKSSLPEHFYYNLHGEFKDIPKKLEEFIEAGCQYYIPWFIPDARVLELMKKFAKEIIPSFKKR